MALGHFECRRHEKPATFDLFFRKCPFGGEYAVFSGLEDCLRYLSEFKFGPAHIDYLRTILPPNEPFLSYLANLNTSEVKVYALEEGSLCFPRIPLLRVEGPLGICQILETALLNCVNFATLCATNARRFRQVAGPNMVLMEFGLRRAQGCDGAMSASRNSYVGGFNGTSNLLAAYRHHIAASGTHAHAFVCSFFDFDDIPSDIWNLAGLADSTKGEGLFNFVDEVRAIRHELGYQNTHEGELAAFTAYALTFPRSFVALVDTYDTLKSGVPNALIVCAALRRFGYAPRGIRLDSGDLAELSKAARQLFREVAQKVGDKELESLRIVASDDLTEDKLIEMNEQGHEINVLGIGTHLVTCLKQPALGGVYKLADIDSRACIKLSQNVAKVTLPGRKMVYRLYDNKGMMLGDAICMDSEAPPSPGRVVLHPTNHPQSESVFQVESVRPLLVCVFDGKPLVTCSAEAAKTKCAADVAECPANILFSRHPATYPVCITDALRDLRQSLCESAQVK
eukprot:c11294_g1_i1.p1 GENE.c11294_g1_i1~~c11294_g1_i1.p1  ORF type:complete len:547 (-),score=101.31 c11294_g1_i1:46-1578(-)